MGLKRERQMLFDAFEFKVNQEDSLLRDTLP